MIFFFSTCHGDSWGRIVRISWFSTGTKPCVSDCSRFDELTALIDGLIFAVYPQLFFSNFYFKANVAEFFHMCIHVYIMSYLYTLCM